MIITCGNVKGGVGKSCTAQNIACYLAVVLGKNVVIVDTDPQGTTADWYEAREQDGTKAKIAFRAINKDIRTTLLDLEETFDAVIVDCGGHNSELMYLAMGVATHGVVPFRPKRRDLKTLPSMVETLSIAKSMNPNGKFRALITQAPTNTGYSQRVNGAKDACKHFDIEALENVISSRNIYDDAEESGGSIFEYKAKTESDKNAVREFTAVVNELLGV